jgi:beta-galactosidase
VNAKVFLEGQPAAAEISVELRDGDTIISSAKAVADKAVQELNLNDLGNIELWDIKTPRLYNVHVTLSSGGKIIDHYDTRIGFREAKFTPEGFYLNGKHLKLRGPTATRPTPLSARPCRPADRSAMHGS